MLKRLIVIGAALAVAVPAIAMADSPSVTGCHQVQTGQCTFTAPITGPAQVVGQGYWSIEITRVTTNGTQHITTVHNAPSGPTTIKPSDFESTINLVAGDSVQLNVRDANSELAVEQPDLPAAPAAPTPPV
ncbi:MAG: hypothetical protein ACYDAY_03860 [Candidatus Dormibacteria bacterium]